MSTGDETRRFGLDGLEAVHGRLVDGFVGIVDRLAGEPPSAREVTEIADLLRSQPRGTGRGLRPVVRAARDELFGAAPDSLADILAETDELTPERLTAAAAEARDDMLLMVPSGHRPPAGRYFSTGHLSPRGARTPRRQETIS